MIIGLNADPSVVFLEHLSSLNTGCYSVIKFIVRRLLVEAVNASVLSV